MPGALDDLRPILDAVAVVEVALRPRLHAITQLRGALGVFETTLRAATEAQLVSRVGAAIGVEIPPGSGMAAVADAERRRPRRSSSG